MCLRITNTIIVYYSNADMKVQLCMIVMEFPVGNFFHNKSFIYSKLVRVHKILKTVKKYEEL